MCKDNEKQTYSISEIAQLLGITYEEAFELTNHEDFPNTEITQIVVVSAKDFVDWLMNQAENNRGSK